MTYINKSTLTCARDMWKVPDTLFPTCEYFRYMAAYLSDVHYGTLSDDLYMRIKRYDVFALYLQPRFSNNASECLKKFNRAMPLKNMVQGPIPLPLIQVQTVDKHNISCRVDVQRIWADFISQRIRTLHNTLINHLSICPSNDSSAHNADS